ncbi:hypothetical protein DV737_g4419, partial [Chaetothyriales sp. CBS 132003]
MAQKRKLSDAVGASSAADKPDKKARTSQEAPASPALTAGDKRQAKSERRANKGKQGKNAGSDFVSLQVPDTAPAEKPASEFTVKARAEKQERKARKKEAAAADAAGADASKEDTAMKHRFIAFVGNLPFNTTTEALEKHFSGVAPFKLRHSTDKASGKSKGFAFIEFDHYDRMKTCLQLYHHSYFSQDTAGTAAENEGTSASAGGAADGQDKGSDSKKKGKKDKGRRINVELTAGGGGKSFRRQERIKLKNRKLAEQRERKVMRAHEEREKARAGAAEPEKQEEQAGPTSNNNSSNDTTTTGNVHPSRLKMMRHK